MDIMMRVDTLLESEFSTEEDHADLCKVIAIFQERHGLAITEENAGIMITHMAAAFRRNRTGELIEPLADAFEEVKESPHFPMATAIMDEIARQVSNEVSDNEREFFLLHICSLLVNENNL